jgi:phage anti-repressor protein
MIHEMSVSQKCDTADLVQVTKGGDNFSNWIKHRIGKYGFIENIDYVTFTQTGEPDNQFVPSLLYQCIQPIEILIG